VEAVQALAGVMNGKAATKGILVTTSWFGKASRDLVARNGRMELIDGRNLTSMLLEHLGLDVLIGLPKLPSGWEPQDLTYSRRLQPGELRPGMGVQLCGVAWTQHPRWTYQQRGRTGDLMPLDPLQAPGLTLTSIGGGRRGGRTLRGP